MPTAYQALGLKLFSLVKGSSPSWASQSQLPAGSLFQASFGVSPLPSSSPDLPITDLSLCVIWSVYLVCFPLNCGLLRAGSRLAPPTHLQEFQSSVLEIPLGPLNKGMNMSIPNLSPPSPATQYKTLN